MKHEFTTQPDDGHFQSIQDMIPEVVQHAATRKLYSVEPQPIDEVEAMLDATLDPPEQLTLPELRDSVNHFGTVSHIADYRPYSPHVSIEEEHEPVAEDVLKFRHYLGAAAVVAATGAVVRSLPAMAEFYQNHIMR